MYVLTALFHESWVTEPWELTEMQDSDLPEFTFKESRSEKYINDYIARAKDASKELLPDYAESLTKLKNEGENSYNLDAYKVAVCKLMKLQPPQATAVS
ncbi:28S ribosomal protein S35 [Tropilaelaps mercedesae]|uniref:28S ribosomal protein S35 n=1 Tax=Tropilaelaps mercedesae TaxID=418985 RepID=A0A1V9XJX0_9ACAR|nr:28S ribosomal protein S35 [Tropilaelaps mercedesae]